MSTTEMQQLLGRIYMDRSFRRLFELDPEDAFAGYDLEPGEKAAIRGIPLRAIKETSDSLVGKRRARLMRYFGPLFAVGFVANKAFPRYCEIFASSATASAARDCEEFGLFIEEYCLADPAVPAHLADIARFCRIVAQVRLQELPSDLPLPPSRPCTYANVQVAKFDWAITDSVMGKTEVHRDPPVRRQTWLVFKGPTPGSPMKIFSVTHAMAALIQKCDGRRDPDDIRQQLSVSAPLAADKIRHALSQLRDARILLSETEFRDE